MDLKIGSKNPIHNRKKLSSWKIFIDCPLIKFPSSSFFNARLRSISHESKDNALTWECKRIRPRLNSFLLVANIPRGHATFAKMMEKEEFFKEDQIESVNEIAKTNVDTIFNWIFDWILSDVTASCYTHTISFSIVCVCANGRINEKMCRGSSSISIYFVIFIIFFRNIENYFSLY